VDHGKELNRHASKGSFHICRVHWPAPRSLYPVDLSAQPGGHVHHTLAKKAVDANKDLVLRLNQVGKAKLHPGASRTTSRKGDLVSGLEKPAQHPLNLFHDPEKKRIQVTDQGLRDGC
jgi:hypothetical protein